MIPKPKMSDVAVRGQGGRFEFVDALRGLAALAVVMPHAQGLFIYPHESWLTSLALQLGDYGKSGVEIFFVVSGFAIAYSLRESANEDFNLGRFMLRRAVRLDPPYWVALLWAGVVTAIRAAATHQAIVLPSLGKVLAHVFYLQDILGLGQFNIVFWTLCLEFQLYFVFATMMRVASAIGRRPREARSRGRHDADKFGWLMAIAFMVSLVVSHTVWPLGPGWFVPYFYLFLSGSLAAWRTLDRISERLFQICLLAMGLALLLRPELARVLGFLTALVLYAAIHRGALHRWLAARWAQWLGRLSYSIYLVHVPLGVFFLGLRTRVALDSKLMSLVCLAGMYAVTLGLASVLHVAVEVPCLRLSRQLKRQRSVEVPRLQRVPPA
jgi:peptidoglycan/LPS O-acetylase OafA/YrhL